jgi:hypothetical protein
MTHSTPPTDLHETPGLRTLEDLLFPVTEADFMRDYDGHQPLHIPASDRAEKADILTWDAFNGLLQQAHVWTAETLRLMLDGQAVRPEQYCKPIPTPSGPILRASPSMVDVFLSGGASLVANDVLHAHPPLTHVGQILGRTFAATVGANVYCSFQGIRAFGSHYDNHDVFVVQTEGEKVWTLYENRADNPVDLLPGNDDTQRFFERSRGAVMSQVQMRRGDVLYLPRGWYHDALATDGASLHVTYSVTPITGKAILDVLHGLASKQSAYRGYLAPAEREAGVVLRRQLDDLAALLQGIIQAPDFLDEVAAAQRRVQPMMADFTLPIRKPATLYRVTGRAFPATTKALRQLYDWAIAERQFALEDMIATFDGLSPDQVRSAIDAADQAGAVVRV